MIFKAIIPDACIRGCEIRQNQKGEDYVLVRYEDETGEAKQLVDKDTERAKFYKRDNIMDLYISIDQGREFTNIRIIDAKKKAS